MGKASDVKSGRLLLRCCTLELPTDHGTKRTQMKLSFSAKDVQNLRNCPSSMRNTSLIKIAPDQGLNNRRISSRFLLTCFCTNHSYSSFSETSPNLLLKLLVFCYSLLGLSYCNPAWWLLTQNVLNSWWMWVMITKDTSLKMGWGREQGAKSWWPESIDSSWTQGQGSEIC